MTGTTTIEGRDQKSGLLLSRRKPGGNRRPSADSQPVRTVLQLLGFSVAYLDVSDAAP